MWRTENGATTIIPEKWVQESTEAHSTTGQSGTYSGYGCMGWMAAGDYHTLPTGSYATSGHGGHTVKILPHPNTVIVLRVNTDAPDWKPINEPDDAVRGILETRLPAVSRAHSPGDTN
jgi:CubicO group peptidase (beta-lactamase class C family)